MKAQQVRVLDYLNEHASITSLEALEELGIFRLSARISELKSQGHKIQKKSKAIINRFGEKVYIAEYSLEREQNGN